MMFFKLFCELTSGLVSFEGLDERNLKPRRTFTRRFLAEALNTASFLPRLFLMRDEVVGRFYLLLGVGGSYLLLGVDGSYLRIVERGSSLRLSKSWSILLI